MTDVQLPTELLRLRSVAGRLRELRAESRVTASYRSPRVGQGVMVPVEGTAVPAVALTPSDFLPEHLRRGPLAGVGGELRL